MAFSTRRFVKHIDKYDTTHRIEIQEDGFGGTASSIRTTGRVFRFEHETHTGSDEELLNVYENPVQKGSIELHLLIQDSTDRTLIDDIFNGDEDDFRLIWKIDGSIYWTGTVLNDMLEYPESDFPYSANLWAKDFSHLKGVDYSLTDSRQTLITTFANLLDNLGYGLDIETHTSWINENTTDSVDFLQQIYHETKALRDFGRTGDETDQPIGAIDALEMLCRNFGCVVRQEGGVFKIIQYSEYETPSDVNVTVYDSTGTEKTAATSTDLALDASANDITITDRSITKAFKAIRRAQTKFDHRTEISGVEFPDLVELEDGQTTGNDFQQLFIGDGSQYFNLSFDVYCETDLDQDTMEGRVNVSIDNYELQDDDTFSTDSNLWYEVDLTFRKPFPGGGGTWSGSVSIDRVPIPNGADGVMTIEFAGVAGNADFADFTRYSAISMSIENPVASENSTSINYELTQSGSYSTTLTMADTWFGDGPTPYSVSALRFGSGDGDVTADDWQRRGSISYRNFHENLLKEVIDLQRSNRIRTDGQSVGADYDAEKIISYRSKNLAYTGGSFVGEEGDWHPVLFEINIQTGSDTFDDILKFTDETGSGSGSTSSGGGGGGISQGDADNRYFRQSQAFDELATADIDTALTNLGLKSGNRDLNLNSISINGTNLFPDDDPQALGTGDSPTFGGGTFNGGITGTTADFSGALDADTIRTDTGKFLSPADYAFRNAGDSGYRAFTAESSEFHVTNDNRAGVRVFRNSATGRAQLSLYDETDSLLWRFGQTAGGGTAFNFYDGTKDFLSLIPGESSAELDANWKISGYQLIDRTGSYSSGNYFRFEHFSDDTLGIGWGASPNALTFETNNDLTTGRNLFVLGGLFAQEFVVEQTRVMFDFRMAPGGGKIEAVTGSSGSETITLSNEFQAANPLSVGAIIRIQQRTGQSSGVIIKNIVRRVDSISGMDASLATSGITWGTGDDVGSIESGDDVVYEGHVSDSTLDHYIHFDISGVDIPAIRFWDEVNDVGGGFEPLRVGGMDGYDGSITGDIGIAGKTKTDGAVFWITEDEARLGNFTIKDDYLTDQNIYIGNNLSSFIDAGRIYIGNRLDGTQPRIGIVGGDTSNFMEFFYNNAGSWGVTGRIGGNDVFRFGSTNLIAGAFFDADRIYNYDSNGGAELNWTNQFLKFYEDNGVTSRFRLENTTSLKTSTSERDSTTSFSPNTSDTINVDSGDIVESEVEAENPDASESDVTIRWQGFDGSWQNIQSFNFSLAGNSTQQRSFSGRLTGYSQFRCVVQAAAGDTVQIGSYSATSYITEMQVTKGGISILGGSMFMSDFPELADDFEIATNQVYLEPDGSGDYYLKVKG